MSVVVCYADRTDAIIMADSFWTDTSGNGHDVFGSRKVYSISIGVICGIAGNSSILKVYEIVMNEFLFGAHFFDEVLEYIDSNRKELCSFIPKDKIGVMIIAGYTDIDRSDIKVAELYFDHCCVRGKIHDEEYPRIAIALPPDLTGIDDRDVMKYIDTACGNLCEGIESLICECIKKSVYCDGDIGTLLLPR